MGSVIVLANVGIPMIVLQLPLMLAALSPTIVIEGLIAARETSLSRRKVFAGVLCANTASTLLGVPCAWGLMLVLNLVTTGGSALGLSSPLARLASVALQASWLVPYHSARYWMIPSASLVLLLPSFLVSVWMEKLICYRMWQPLGRGIISRVVWHANAASYGLLFVVGVMWLVYSVAAGAPTVSGYSGDALLHSPPAVRAKAACTSASRRTSTPIPAGAPDTWRHLCYNNDWQVLETRKSASENTAPQTLQPEYQYVWSLRYIDAAVRRDENTDADDLCDDETLYYLNDANMNVTCLTDTGGDAVERYVYDPYGKVTILNGASGVDKDGAVTEWTEDGDQTASDVDNSHLYCGYYHDWETGLYHVRNRTYHPTLGRWMTRDPIGYGDGMSLYEYVASCPVASPDPAGLFIPGCSAPKKKPCCCCCAEDMVLENVQGPHTWSGRIVVGEDQKGKSLSEPMEFYGFDFDVVPVYSMVEFEEGEPGVLDCDLEWNERPDYPIKHQKRKVHKPGQFYNMFDLLPNSEQVKQWGKHPKPCPSESNIRHPIHDAPATGLWGYEFEQDPRGGFMLYKRPTTAKSTIDFKIVLKSSTDPRCKDKCKYTSCTLEFTTFIEVVGGKGAVDEKGNPTSYLKPKNPKASCQ